jgi:ATP-dependent helicase/nuclease subunit B
VRTAAEFEREERALFESALARATMLVTLSWPEFDGRGESNLKSLYLEEALWPKAEAARSVRPRAGQVSAQAVSPAIRDATLLPILREKTATISPTGLENFLQCPFQYFAGKILKLRPAPTRPQERLTFLIQGQIVHEVLKEWWAQPQDIAAVFERVFASTLEAKHVPFGYHSERVRFQILDDLRRFAAHGEWQRGAFQSRTEEDFQLPLDGVTIRGKIDRLDTGADGKAYVIDYKYSATKRVKAKLKNANLLQAPLYLLAAQECLGARPEGMFYIGLKGEVVYAGWSHTPLLDSLPAPENWLAATRERTLRIVEEIRSGRVEPAPADTDLCVFCDFRDACRIDVGAAEEEEAEGA